MAHTNIQSELASIRNLMERSTKFLSLSGLSGVLAGIYALIGGSIVYNVLEVGDQELPAPDFKLIITIALFVLLLSITTGFVLTSRQAKKNGEALLNPVSKRFVVSMAIPLMTGGAFILILLMQGYFHLIAASCLIFYGLSLIAAGEYSFSAVKWLGAFDIIIGLLAALFPAYGLLLWMFGFGVLHIVYGIWMHIKYNK